MEEAVLRWTQTLHLNEASLALLHQVTFQIRNLEGLTLGQTLGTMVTADTDAAGYGWFIDSTPYVNIEFKKYRAGSELIATFLSPAYGDMDLLTVVMHELGHVLGFPDTNPTKPSHGLMGSTLDTGEHHLVSDSRWHPRVVMDSTKEGISSVMQPATPWVLGFLTDAAVNVYNHPNKKIQVVI